MNYVVHSLAKIVNEANLTIGDHTQIDDFVFLNAGKSTHIGRHVHIASFCSFIGGGDLVVGDFAGISAGSRIMSGTDDFTGRAMTNPTVPSKYTLAQTSFVNIGRHVIIGTSAIIFPGVTIGEGAAVGAGCLVRKDLEPWTIYAGFDCLPIRPRQSETILRMEQELAAEEAAAQ